MLGYSSNTLTRLHLRVVLCMVLLLQLVLEVDSMNGIEEGKIGEEEVGDEDHLIHDAYADEEVLSFAEDEDGMPLDERIGTRHTTPFVRVMFALFDPACSLAGCNAQTQGLDRPILMSYDLQDALQPQAEREETADYDSNSGPDHGTLAAAATEKGTKLVHMRVGSTQYILCSLINEENYALRIAHARFSAKSFSSSDDGIPYDMPEVKLDRVIPSGEETSFMLKLSLPEHRVGIRANLAVSLTVKGVRAVDAFSDAIDLMHIDLVTVQQNENPDEYRAAAGLLSFLLSACALFLVFRESSSR